MAVLFTAKLTIAQTSFETINLQGSETYWDGSDYSGVSDGFGLFDTLVYENNFVFPNQYDTTWGASWGYWSDGWAFSNQTADTLTGLTGNYSSYAGGANIGSKYAIGKQNSTLYFDSITGMGGVELYVTNVNYTAHSMLNGDAFAKQFGSIYDANGAVDGTNGEDWLLLTAIGYDINNNITDSVEFYLADYRFSDSTQDYIVKDWTVLGLAPLGNVAKVQFKLSSSDTGQFGMNTPAFFAIDDVAFFIIDGIDENSLETKIYPNPASELITIETNTSKGEIRIYDITGKLILSTIFNSNQAKIDVSHLDKGSYILVTSNNTSQSVSKIIIE